MQITLYYSPFLHLFRAIFYTIADPKFFSFFTQGKSQNSELFNLLAQKTKILMIFYNKSVFLMSAGS